MSVTVAAAAVAMPLQDDVIDITTLPSKRAKLHPRDDESATDDEFVDTYAGMDANERHTDHFQRVRERIAKELRKELLAAILKKAEAGKDALVDHLVESLDRSMEWVMMHVQRAFIDATQYQRSYGLNYPIKYAPAPWENPSPPHRTEEADFAPDWEPFIVGVVRHKFLSELVPSGMRVLHRLQDRLAAQAALIRLRVKLNAEAAGRVPNAQEEDMVKSVDKCRSTSDATCANVMKLQAALLQPDTVPSVASMAKMELTLSGAISELTIKGVSVNMYARDYPLQQQ
jgi:hypothetical protein